MTTNEFDKNILLFIVCVISAFIMLKLGAMFVMILAIMFGIHFLKMAEVIQEDRRMKVRGGSEEEYF
jgi:hypothetical protein